MGASNRGHLVADFSGSQRFLTPRERYVPDLVAPGAGVVSAKPGRGYQSMDGTSMATPHVAGLAALLWSAEPSSTMGDIEAAITQSARPLPSEPDTRQGVGLPDAWRALQILRS